MSSRRFVITLFCSLILCLFLSSCAKQNEQPFQGYIEGDFTYLATPVSGHLQKIAVDRGDWVKKNDLIFVLEKQPEKDEAQAKKHRLDEAKSRLEDFKRGTRETLIRAKRAQISETQADLTYAKKTLARRQRLYRQNAIDKDAVDLAERNYKRNLAALDRLKHELEEARLGRRRDIIEAQRAVVERAQAELKAARWRLEQKVVRAPVNGLVFDTFFELGEFVPADEAVAALLAPEDEKLVFYIPEPVLSRLHVGQKISFDCDHCKQSYTATISFIASEAEFTPPVIFSRERREKLTYRVEARLPIETAQAINIGQPVDVYPWQK